MVASCGRKGCVVTQAMSSGVPGGGLGCESPPYPLPLPRPCPPCTSRLVQPDTPDPGDQVLPRHSTIRLLQASVGLANFRVVDRKVDRSTGADHSGAQAARQARKPTIDRRDPSARTRTARPASPRKRHGGRHGEGPTRRPPRHRSSQRLPRTLSASGALAASVELVPGAACQKRADRATSRERRMSTAGGHNQRAVPGMDDTRKPFWAVPQNPYAAPAALREARHADHLDSRPVAACAIASPPRR